MRMKRVRQAVTVAGALAISLSMAGCPGKSNINITPPGCTGNCPPSPTFLYATAIDQILAFKIDSSTGALGAPLAMPGPNQSLGLSASLTLGHLYISDFLNDTVDGFSINSSTGGLTATPGSPYSRRDTSRYRRFVRLRRSWVSYIRHGSQCQHGCRLCLRWADWKAYAGSGFTFPGRRHSDASGPGRTSGQVPVCEQFE